MEKKNTEENIKKAQLEWEAANKAGEEKRYVDELHHLYNALKNIDTNDLEWIQRINCIREFAFKALGIDELAFLIDNNIERHSYEKMHRDEDLTRKIAPEKLLIQYRLEMLYDYKKYDYNAYKLLDLLGVYNKKKEIEFWVEYLLKFDPDNRDVVFRGMTELVKIGEFQKAIEFGDSIKDDSYIEIVKLFCLDRLKQFNLILNTVDSLKINALAKQEYKMRALVGLYKNNNEYENQLKAQYVEGLTVSSPMHTINYLASSPYVAKYLKNSENTIYHYTNINALKNIVENNILWATKNDFLNDNKEHEYITQLVKAIDFSNDVQKDQIEKALFRYFASINPQFSKEDCDDTLNGFIDETIRERYMDEIYVMSFSTAGDNLTLWGNYSYFQGYNLGFNKNLLIDSMKLNNANEQQDYLIDGRVIYLDENDQEGFLSSMVSEIINDMDAFGVDSCITNQIIIAHLLLMSNFIKNNSMEAEREYRIISIQLKNDGNTGTVREKNVRIKDNSFIPYTVINGKVKESLQCITIGPTNSIDISLKGLKFFLKANGYAPDCPEINKSKITLRY